MLRIKGKATLQKMRDEGRLRFTQPEKKIILWREFDVLVIYIPANWSGFRELKNDNVYMGQNTRNI